MTFWCGSGSGSVDPNLLTNGSGSGSWIVDPAIFVIDLQDANNSFLQKIFCLLLFEGTFTSFSKIKSQKMSQNSRNQSFSYYFCTMIEGSGSGSIPLTNGSKNMWIRIRIQICNTGEAGTVRYVRAPGCKNFLYSKSLSSFLSSLSVS
jgi:hypothetical protein